MSMTDNTSSLGEAKPGKTDDASSSSDNTEGSEALVVRYEKNWGQNGPLKVTYNVTLKTAAEGASVLLTNAYMSKTLGPIPPGRSTTFTGADSFTEKQAARLIFEVISGPNSDRRQFDVERASFTP